MKPETNVQISTSLNNSNQKGIPGFAMERDRLKGMQQSRLLANKRIFDLLDQLKEKKDFLNLEEQLYDRDEKRETKYYFRFMCNLLCQLISRLASRFEIVSKFGEYDEVLEDTESLFKHFMRDEIDYQKRTGMK